MPGLSRVFRNKSFLKFILNLPDIETKQNLIFIIKKTYNLELYLFIIRFE